MLNSKTIQEKRHYQQKSAQPAHPKTAPNSEFIQKWNDANQSESAYGSNSNLNLANSINPIMGIASSNSSSSRVTIKTMPHGNGYNSNNNESNNIHLTLPNNADAQIITNELASEPIVHDNQTTTTNIILIDSIENNKLIENLM